MTRDNISLIRQLAYTERKDINEFIRDDKILNKLYNLVLQKVFDNKLSQERVLTIYNNAYYECTIVMNGGKMNLEIIASNSPSMHGRIVEQKITHCLIMSILGLHKGFEGFNDDAYIEIRSLCKNYECYGEFSEFIRLNSYDFKSSVNFSYTPVAPSELKTRFASSIRSWADATNRFQPEYVAAIIMRYQQFGWGIEILDIIQRMYMAFRRNFPHSTTDPKAKDSMITTEEIEKLRESLKCAGDKQEASQEVKQEQTPEETFLELQLAAKVQFDKVVAERNELREKLAKQEEDHRRELTLRESAEKLLRGENDTLQSTIKDLTEQLNDLRTRSSRTRIVREVVKVKSPEGTVFSAKNMSTYAKGLDDDSDAAVIATMMKDVCLRNQYYDTDCLAEIDSIKIDRKKARDEEEARKRTRKQAPSHTYNIEHVDQLNPTAQSVNNHHIEATPQTQERSAHQLYRSHYDEVEEFMNERHGIYKQ